MAAGRAIADDANILGGGAEILAAMGACKFEFHGAGAGFRKSERRLSKRIVDVNEMGAPLSMSCV